MLLKKKSDKLQFMLLQYIKKLLKNKIKLKKKNHSNIISQVSEVNPASSGYQRVHTLTPLRIWDVLGRYQYKSFSETQCDSR